MMKTSAKRVASSGAAIAAVAIVVAGVWGVSSAVNSAPEPTPTPTVIEVATHVGTDENGLAGEQEAEAAAAEAARIEAERVAAEAAAAEAARAAAEEAARAAEAERVSQQTVTAPSSGNSGGSQPAPAAPIRCPAGTLANSSDGVNDTSCLAEICFSIAVPDPAHPECDQAFRP